MTGRTMRNMILSHLATETLCQDLRNHFESKHLRSSLESETIAASLTSSGRNSPLTECEMWTPYPIFIPISLFNCKRDATNCRKFQCGNSTSRKRESLEQRYRGKFNILHWILLLCHSSDEINVRIQYFEVGSIHLQVWVEVQLAKCCFCWFRSETC